MGERQAGKSKRKLELIPQFLIQTTEIKELLFPEMGKTTGRTSLKEIGVAQI